MCVHLAGSYQGLALPYDRYKRGGDRETLEARGKEHRAGFIDATRPTHTLSHMHGQLKDNDLGNTAGNKCP